MDLTIPVAGIKVTVEDVICQFERPSLRVDEIERLNHIAGLLGDSFLVRDLGLDCLFVLVARYCQEDATYNHHWYQDENDLSYCSHFILWIGFVQFPLCVK